MDAFLPLLRAEYIIQEKNNWQIILATHCEQECYSGTQSKDNKKINCFRYFFVPEIYFRRRLVRLAKSN